MRVQRILLAGIAALALSGCAGMQRTKTGIVPPPPGLRTTIADVRAPVIPASAPVVAAPAPVVRASAPVIAAPVVAAPAAIAPVAVAVSACSPIYTLDSGDRLRILVFGQEGLSNVYAVDADGNVMMPLIGTVPARGLTKEDLAYTIT